MMLVQSSELLRSSREFPTRDGVQVIAVTVDLLTAQSVKAFCDHRHGNAQGLADLLGLQRALSRTKTSGPLGQ